MLTNEQLLAAAEFLEWPLVEFKRLAAVEPDVTKFLLFREEQTIVVSGEDSWRMLLQLSGSYEKVAVTKALLLLATNQFEAAHAE